MLASCFCWEFLLHIPCWLQFYAGSFSYTSHAGFLFFFFFNFYLGSFSYTSRAVLIFIWGVSLTHPCRPFCFVFNLVASLRHPVLALFFSGEFFLHVPCWLNLYLGSFSYTSRAGFIFIWGVSITHPVLALFLLLWVSLTRPILASSTPSSVLIWRVSLPHPVLAFFFFFFLNLGSFSYWLFYLFIFYIWGVSLTHPVLALLFFG